jgi:hypothetical protein
VTPLAEAPFPPATTAIILASFVVVLGVVGVGTWWIDRIEKRTSARHDAERKATRKEER